MNEASLYMMLACAFFGGCCGYCIGYMRGRAAIAKAGGAS